MEKQVGLAQLGSYSKALVELGMERYCNHSKVIRYADGLPVFTCTLPPLYSAPYANSQVNNMFSVMQNRPLPNLVSIALTDKCNARCEHCSFYTDLDEPGRATLTLEELKDVVRQSQELGASVIDFVGGEPLMYPHWRELLESVDKRKTHLLMFTNGWFLKDAAADLKKAGLGAIFVSIDGSTAESHDKKRGLPGLFDKAMEGVAAAKAADLTVGFSCCVDEQGFKDGELDNIIELAKRQGVHEVLVFDAMPVGRLSERDDLDGLVGATAGATSWIDRMIDHVKKYNDDKSYPGVLIYAYMTSFKALGCMGGACYYYVSPYGDVCPCDFHHHKFGNVKEERVYQIWDKMISKMGCNGCNWTGCWTKHK
jgi:MoaA/NifB/PqqE/SkfB family radical SAM enzyme